MTIREAISQDVTPHRAVQAIIETSRKQWAAQSVAQTNIAALPRPRRGKAKQAGDFESEYDQFCCKVFY